MYFFCPYRIVDPNFTTMTGGFYQEQAGSNQIEFNSIPSLMLDLSEYNSFSGKPSLGYVKALFNTTPSDASHYFVSRKNSLLDYVGYQTPVQEVNPADLTVMVEPFELVRILAFWKIYFEYFVNENVGYEMKPIFNGSTSIYPVKVVDGRNQEVVRVFTYDEFMDCYLGLTGGNFLDKINSDDPLDRIIKPEVWPQSESFIFNLLCLPNVNFRKDYFTSALPWAQKGRPVSLPVFDNAKIELPSLNVTMNRYENQDNQPVRYHPNASINGPGLSVGESSLDRALSLRTVASEYPLNVTTTQPLTINDLRTSIKMQEWLERNARGGTRYTEQIRSHFGVRPADSRLQRPEYIGGYSSPIHISEVLQTSETNATPLADMAGHGVSASSSGSWRYFCEEHGYIFGISYVTLKPYYCEGADRNLFRKNFYDYYWPEFAHLGERPILKKELFAGIPKTATSADAYKGHDHFGYQSMYSEYKHNRNQIHGDFLGNSLRSWVFGARIFSDAPDLTPEFIEVNTKKQPILNSPWPNLYDDYDHIWIRVINDINSLRPMPKYGVPRL